MQRVFGQTHCIRAPLFILLKVSHMSYYITCYDGGRRVGWAFLGQPTLYFWKDMGEE